MNKKVLLIIIAVVIVLAGSGVYILSVRKAPQTVDQTTNSQDPVIGTLSPQDIGLKLEMSHNNQQVKIVADNVSGVSSLEYEITYDADIPASEQIAGGETRTTRGFDDEAKIASGQTKYTSKVFDLGSCSKNVCRYDTGVNGLQIVMKVTKTDGKVYQVKDEIKF